MKRFGWILFLFLITSPAWAGRKITVSQLEDMLRSLQQDKKSDTDAANALKLVELTEELTLSKMNTLIQYVAGPHSTEQIYVLEALSSDLIPPSSDLPSVPPPDAAGQQAILEKAAAYVTNTYEHLPSLTATSTTLRFQDNVEAATQTSKASKEAATESVSVNPSQFIHFINSTGAQVSIEHGVEQLPQDTKKIAWGANKMIALEQPDPSLGAIFNEAQDSGTIKWLRWELVNGKQVAVYSFAVPKKRSRFALNVCCFPEADHTGTLTSSDRPTGPDMANASHGVTGPIATGDFKTNTNWKNYRVIAPYHGEFFIDPETGTVAQLIAEPELKPTEVVHQQDTRIDYGPVLIDGKTMILPMRTITNTEVVPYGDIGSAGMYSTRRTLFITEYKNYQLAGGK
jgi:hypothetical protein